MMRSGSNRPPAAAAADAATTSTSAASAATTTAATAVPSGRARSRSNSNNNNNNNNITNNNANANNPPPPKLPISASLSPAAMAVAAAKSNRRPLPDTYSTLVASVASFLAVSIHQILFLRSVYPQYTFLPVRQFNHPVRQSRHPRVCSWISDACTAVEAQLLKSTVAAVSVVILSVSTNRPLERYTFDMTQMPKVNPSDIHTPFESSVGPGDGDVGREQGAGAGAAAPPQQKDGTAKSAASSIDLEAQFRAVLARLASACARLTPLPPDEEYLPTLHIVLRPDAEAPAGVAHDDQMWIAADPDHDSSDSPRNSQQSLNDNDFPDSYRALRKSEGNVPASTAAALAAGADGTEKEKTSRARAKTVPVRTVDAGEVKLEVWVEEAMGKFAELDRIQSVNP